MKTLAFKNHVFVNIGLPYSEFGIGRVGCLRGGWGFYVSLWNASIQFVFGDIDIARITFG